MLSERSESGLAGIRHNGVDYLVRKNVFGDITRLYAPDGGVAARYDYDAWGNPRITVSGGHRVGELNPFLYRGYCYDRETGYYYLRTRYYDPEACRFLSPDDPSLLLLTADHANGIMSYTYCADNPVMMTDSTGQGWWQDFWNGVVGKTIGTLLVITAVVALSIVTAGVGGAVTAALGGGFWAAVAGGAVGGAISGAVFGSGYSIVSQGITNGYGDVDWGKVGIDTLIGASSGALMGAVFAAGGRALGLLGKTRWAQRPVDFSKSKNFMFGSKSGNFTFIRNGAKFRIEASVQHGIHIHFQTIKNGIILIGRSVPRTTLVNAIWNTIVGVTSSSIWQFM